MGGFLVVPLQLGDYAEGDWFFIAVCGACGREAILEPADILARAGTGKVHRGMHLSDLDILLRCRGLPSLDRGADRTGRQNS